MSLGACKEFPPLQCCDNEKPDVHGDSCAGWTLPGLSSTCPRIRATQRKLHDAFRDQGQFLFCIFMLLMEVMLSLFNNRITGRRLAPGAFEVRAGVWDWSRGSLGVAPYAGFLTGCPTLAILHSQKLWQNLCFFNNPRSIECLISRRFA